MYCMYIIWHSSLYVQMPYGHMYVHSTLFVNHTWTESGSLWSGTCSKHSVHSDSTGFHETHHGLMRWRESYSLAAGMPPRIRTVLSSGAWGTVSIQFHLQPEWRVQLAWKAGFD